MQLAIVGTGMIVGHALEALRFVPEIKVTALYARPHSREKGEALARQYGIGRVVTDYAELLRLDNVDCVYIGNVNSVHYAYSKQALEAGKDLIVEKPMCVSEEEAVSLREMARERGRYVFEALTFLHAPFFQELRHIAGRLGTIRVVQCNYSKYSSRYDRYLHHDVAPVFDPALAGGALLDLNIYNLNFVVGLFGEPQQVYAMGNRGYNGVDLSGIVTLKYLDFVATCTAAKDSYSPCFDMVQGERGWMRICGSPDNLEKLEIVVDGKSEEINLQTSEHRMVDEFRDFERMQREKSFDEMMHYLDHSVAIARIADKALKLI